MMYAEASTYLYRNGMPKIYLLLEARRMLSCHAASLTNSTPFIFLDELTRSMHKASSLIEAFL